MDRIDMQIDVPAVQVSDLDAPPGESSAAVAARVAQARHIQQERYAALEKNLPVSINAHVEGKILEEIATMDTEAKTLLDQTMHSAKLSARGYYRVLRVARTIADLSGAPDKLSKAHIAEALSYRRILLN